ncbi:histidine kinase [Streptomyces sp. NPDC091416]|uniref:sensor histidine kinase n=1 Tax=Streptomyces sp. NPDC091416 TaxID=3366003 RepID=UPI003803DC84
MNRTDDRLFPVLLLCAQALVWPGAPLARGAVPAPTTASLLLAALVAAVVTAALALRRTRPVVVLVVVTAACMLGSGPLPAEALAVLGTAGVALALFTVASERDAFTAVLCGVALAVYQLLLGNRLHGLSDRDGLDLVLTAVLYAAVCGTGLLVRRTRRARRAAEHRLKRAEAERHRLPAVERRRMERELHDVSAHHLTAVVVTAGAALGLRERRPELAAQALEFAVETGREVTRALGAVRAPAPSREDEPPPEERLLDLVAGFRRLDHRVDCEIDPLPDGAVAEAAYGIVREALTNVARYAPGAHTRVLCRYGDTRTDVVVTSTPPQAGAVAHGAGLGGGRGQGFLRSRAREAGGTVHSGPTAQGGWEVRAVLAGGTATAVEPSVPRAYRVAQVVAATGLVLQPLLPALAVRAEDTSSASQVSAGALFALLAAGQAVALLWLRRAPRTAYGMLLGLALLWPVAMDAGNYSGPVLLPPALSLLATCAALAREPAPTATPRKGRGAVAKGGPAATGVPHDRACDQPSAPGGHVTAVLLTVLVHAATATTAVLDRGTAAPLWTVIAATTAGAALAATAAHLTGRLRTRRRQAGLRAHDERLATWTEEAVRDAWTERRRIAAGLETTVLARTADLVTEAEAGRLDAAASRAREALAAMRALLDTVREGQAEHELRPQPTLQALDLLARQLRVNGRDIEIRLTGRVPERLPTAVDLAAYHAAETVLTAGGEEPAMLEFDADGAALTLTATGVPRAADSAVRRRLTTRVVALGGTLTTGPQGTISLRLPLAAAQDDEERHR